VHFLAPERATLNSLLPALDESLRQLSLTAMERPGNPALAVFRHSGGTGLLIPTGFGGLGATPLQAVRVQRAIASRAPSLAVATAMHHFSVATVVELAASAASTRTEWLLLEGVARQKLFVASGFAEGRSGTTILASHFQVTRTSEGLVVRGSKKPCSLSASMDLLTASMHLPEDGDLAVALIPATAPGLSRRPFWGSCVLAGAESDEVVLDDVLVPDSLIVYKGNASRLDAVQEKGLAWFELLISATYLGIASALVERVLTAQKGTPAERVQLAIETESVMAALEGLARELADREQGTGLLARILFARFGVQQAVARASMQAAELLGGLSFVAAPDIACLLAACRALAFHPPSRLGAAAALDAYLLGGTLKLE
jgi:alkylation response protein AidB-like acyl-CoA dehydrogenase